MKALAGLVLLALCLLVLPWLLGMLVWAKDARRNQSWGLLLATGYVVLFALFEVVTLPMIALANNHFTWLVILYGGLLTGLAAVSLLLYREQLIRSGRALVRGLRQLSATEWVAIVLILLQTLLLVVFQHTDEDDAFYVATSTTALETDSLYQYNPYTGSLYTSLPSRYVLSPLPLWTAFLARISGLRAVGIAHTALPAVLIPLAYLIYAALAAELWQEKRTEMGLFLIFVSAVHLFSGYSTHSQGVVLLCRIWQGKAILAAILLPFLLLAFYQLYEEETREKWLLVALLSAACCMVSSMGIILGAIAIGLFGFLQALRKKSLRTLVIAVVCALPRILCTGIYLLVL